MGRYLRKQKFEDAMRFLRKGKRIATPEQCKKRMWLVYYEDTIMAELPDGRVLDVELDTKALVKPCWIVELEE